MSSKFQLVLRQVSAGSTPVDTNKILAELYVPAGKALNVTKNDAEGFSMEVVDAPAPKVEAELVDE